MKKTGIKIVSVILALSLIFGGVSSIGASAASDIEKSLKHAGVSVVDGIVTHLLSFTISK